VFLTTYRTLNNVWNCTKLNLVFFQYTIMRGSSFKIFELYFVAEESVEVGPLRRLQIPTQIWRDIPQGEYPPVRRTFSSPFPYNNHMGPLCGMGLRDSDESGYYSGTTCQNSSTECNFHSARLNRTDTSSSFNDSREEDARNYQGYHEDTLL